MKARSFSKDRYFQGDVEDVDKLVPEGSRAAFLQRPRCSRSSTSSSAGSGRRWATPAPRRSRRSSSTRASSGSPAPACARAIRTTHDHEGIAELPAALMASVHPAARTRAAGGGAAGARARPRRPVRAADRAPRPRRARLLELVPHTLSVDEVRRRNPAALILSGGPASVYAGGPADRRVPRARDPDARHLATARSCSRSSSAARSPAPARPSSARPSSTAAAARSSPACPSSRSSG